MAMPATANPGGIAGVTLGDVAGELIAVRVQKKEFNQTQIALVGNEDPTDKNKSVYSKLDEIKQEVGKIGELPQHLIEINETLSKVGIIAAKQLQFITGQASANDVAADLAALQEAASPGGSQEPLALEGPAGSIQPQPPSTPQTEEEQGGMLTSVLKGVRDISLALGGGAALLDIGENIAGFRSDDPRESKRAGYGLAGQAVGGAAGIALGATGGAKLGAMLGTAIGGPLGTLIGGGTGALAGGILGVLLGDEAAKAIFDNFEGEIDKTLEALGKTFDMVSDDFKKVFENFRLPTFDEVMSFINPFYTEDKSEIAGPTEDIQSFDETYMEPQPVAPKKQSFAEMRAEAGRAKGYDPTTGRPLSGGMNTGVPTVEEQRAEDARVRRNRPGASRTRPSQALKSAGTPAGGAPDKPYVFDSQQKAGEAGMLLQKARPETYGGYHIEPMDDGTYFLRMLTKEQVAENQAKMKAAGMDFFKDGGTLEPGKMGVVGEGQDGIPGTDDDQAEFVTTSQPVDIIPRHKIKAYNELRSGMTSAGDRKVLDSFYAEQELNTGYETLLSELSARGDTTGDFLPKDKFGKSEFRVEGIGYDIDRSSMETLKEYPDAFQSKMGIMPKLGDFRGSVKGFGGSKNRYLNKEDFMSALEMERDIAELLLNPDNDVGQKLQTGMDNLQSQKQTPPVVNAPTNAPTVNNTSVSNVSMPMSPKTHDETFTRTNNSNYMFG